MDTPKIAERYVRAARALHTEQYDAIVIGSGIGGLAAAALLAKYGGQRVLVLERHYVAGGYTHTFHRPGYEWDVGVHYLGEMQQGTLVRALFDELTDARLEWADMGDVYDRFVIGNEVYDFPKGKENLRRSLKERFPGDEVAIDGYFALVEQAMASSVSFYQGRVLPEEFAASLPQEFLGFAGRTTRSVLESLTHNQRLIGVLTGQYGDYGLPPAESSFAMHATVANHYFEGGFYPIGGAARIAETIVPLITAAGGRVLINAEVAEIVTENGRAQGVRMARDGAIIRAPLVISDAGVLNTFTRLLPVETRAALGIAQALQPLRPSLAHLCLYIGLTRTARELGLPRANLWIYPDEHHERNLATFVADAEAPLPVIYISFPSAKDPDFERRHPGRATIDIITVAPYERFAAWEGTTWKDRGGEYEAVKERLAQRLLDALFVYVPQAKDHIDLYELSTPLTTKHFCNYQMGELYGLDHTPGRFGQPILRPQTPLPGLYLTGQDIATAGVVGALIGGVLSASAILMRDLVSEIAAARLAPRDDAAVVSPQEGRAASLSRRDIAVG
ncbi:MAG: phytoene desaturase family protein [Candidatus Binatia bacterium]